MSKTPLPPLDSLDPAQEWQPWKPTEQDPWHLKWAGHLYRRAAFGASLPELRLALKDGHEKTLQLLLEGEPKAKGLEKFLMQEGIKVARRNKPTQARGWWLYCMFQSGHPFREKMTLFWHNHFATSINKVQRPLLMVMQNNLLREHGLGKFGPLLQAVSKDPAMLVYLDSNSNVKGRPNENYAREVMELFSLGVATPEHRNYTEKDIQEAARAFTGWHTDDDQFDFNPKFHDDGEKTVLGQKGNFDGGDVIPILLKQPCCARFLVTKLYRYFVSEAQVPPEKLIEPLCEQLRKSDYDVGALMKTMLSSRHFFSAHAYRQRIKSPVEYVLGAVRATVEGTVPVARDNARFGGPGVLVNRLEAMGQQLFAPPNVKGWPHGQSWLNTSTILARQNFAQALVMGNLWNEPVPQDNPYEFFERAVPDGPPGLAKPEEPPQESKYDVARIVQAEKATEPKHVVRLLLNNYLAGEVRPDAEAKLVEFLKDAKPDTLGRRVREATHALLSMPEYQMA